MKFMLPFSFILSFFPFLGHADIMPPIKPPVGNYAYQGELAPKFYQESKLFLHDQTDEQKKIKDLKNQGYTCFRRSITETKCMLKKPFTDFPKGTAEKTKSMLKGYAIHFPEQYDIELSYNSYARKEWLIRGELTIGSRKLGIYRMTFDNAEPVPGSLAFPVDEENAFGVLYVHSDQKFGAPLSISGKDAEGWTQSYFFDAIYTPVAPSAAP